MYLVIKVQTTWQVIMKSPWQRVNYPASDRVLLQIISQFCGWFQSLRKGFFGHFSLGVPLLHTASNPSKKVQNICVKNYGFLFFQNKWLESFASDIKMSWVIRGICKNSEGIGNRNQPKNEFKKGKFSKAFLYFLLSFEHI